MNTPQEQATLYRKAAETIEMCAKHRIEPMAKLNNKMWPVAMLDFQVDYDYYKFPLTVVESKLVWKGDELYMSHGVAFNAYEVRPNPGYKNSLAFFDEFGNCKDLVEKCSWNPPKPKTIMVEMLVEDVERLTESQYSFDSDIVISCRKALDSLNNK